MELLVCCVFAYWFVKHLPEVAAEVAQSIAYGLRGQESPAAQARRQKLEDAGVDPASGGAFGQFAGNLWRDFWLDQDQARAERRAGRAATGTGQHGSWRQRWQDRWDNEVDRRAQAWQRRHAPRPGPEPQQAPRPGRGGHDSPPAASRFDGDSTVHDDSTYRVDNPPTDPHEPSPAGQATPGDPPQPAPQGTREPIRVNATVGQPHPEPARTATAVLELEQGEPDMSATVATRGIPVTGIESGAKECASINAYLETAIAEFQLKLDAVAGRVHAMGEQTLGIVQFAGASDVVTRMAQAAEAVAATKAAAAGLGAEVGPLLTQTRREFLRRA